MAIPKLLLDKLQQFEDNLPSYKTGNYNETQVRHDFIDPLFEAMGWDVNNTEGYAEAYREVVHEDAIKIEGKAKAPDYCFRVGGTRKFFVEAKKPAVNVKDSADPAFQLRRYAWSAKLPLSILTDFEEFAVYDCRIQPHKSDAAGVARIFYCNYKELPEKWDYLLGIFSKTAILKGAFDRFADDKKQKRGTTEVDAAFLGEIEKWRNTLAQNIAKNNPSLSVRNLNYAVQVTIDRIIFLRICEDRGIEEYGRLQSLSQGKDTYSRLLQQFHDADERYNSGLFHFQNEKGRSQETHDALTPTLRIDDLELRQILQSLYYPAPYAFDVFPADILGQVYERFLGKVIVLDNKHRATVEEKPEVKKAGGVYYTPTYIVDYIVGQTVGRALEGRTPKTAAALRICDPACGSGSFLLGAYARLLDWHLRWYIDNGAEQFAKGKAPVLYRSSLDEWRLTTAERKRILLNSLYGVDIDAQAVEVTKLSLLLKMLEGETKESVNAQLSLSLGRVLPDLGGNVQCGNSLIGSDFYDDKEISLFDEDEIYRVNVFDWSKRFPTIFQGDNPGFDCVIGNPPYIRIQALKEFAPKEVEFYKTKYLAAGKGSYDIYVVFIEKALSLLNRTGRIGFITPHKFFNSKYGEPIRRIIADGQNLSEIVHFGDKQIFSDATTYTCLLFLDRIGTDNVIVSTVKDINQWKLDGTMLSGFIEAKKITEQEWNFSSGVANLPLLDKLFLNAVPLSETVNRIYQGVITSADNVFLFKEYRDRDAKTIEVFSKRLDRWIYIEREIIKDVVRSGSISRYKSESNCLVLFPYFVSSTTATLYTHTEMENNFPLAWQYLLENRSFLEEREKGAFSDSKWYRYGRSQNLGLWEREKIMVPYMISRLCAFYDADKHHYFVNVTTGGYGIISMCNPHFLCGLLNSKLLDFCLRTVTTNFNSGYYAANKQYIEQLPIRVLDQSDPVQKQKHDDIVKLVENMLDLTAKLATATPATRTVLKMQAELTDNRLDQAVYALYGLTPAEIEIVENAVATPKPPISPPDMLQ